MVQLLEASENEAALLRCEVRKTAARGEGYQRQAAAAQAAEAVAQEEAAQAHEEAEHAVKEAAARETAMLRELQSTKVALQRRLRLETEQTAYALERGQWAERKNAELAISIADMRVRCCRVPCCSCGWMCMSVPVEMIALS